MDNTLLSKILAVCVVLLVIGVVAVPLINAANTETREETTTHTFVNNSLEPYIDVIAGSVRGSVAPEYTAYRSDTFGHADPSGEYVTYPSATLTHIEAYTSIPGSVILYSGGDNHSINYTANGLPITITYAGATIHIEASEDNNQIAEVTVTEPSDDVIVVVRYDVEYAAPTPTVYGTNTINSTTINDTLGNMSGTTFTPTSTGEWLNIPLRILNSSAQTYKVLSGETYYAPDANGDLAAFTAPSTAGVNSAVSLTFTQDTAITTDTIYILTGTATDTDLPGVVIKKDVAGSVIRNFAPVKVVSSFKTSLGLTSNGDLYVTGLNDKGQLGLGDNTDRTSWTLSAHDVADIFMFGGNQGVSSFYIDTSGALYACGWGGGYGLGTGSTTDVNVWTKVMDSGVSKVYFGSAYNAYSLTTYCLSTTGVLYEASYNHRTFEQILTGVAEFYTDSSASFFAYIDGSGDLYVKGTNSGGQLGLGDTTAHTNWTVSAHNVSKVALVSDTSNAYGSSYYIDTSGDLYATGVNSSGQLGLGDTTNRSSWEKVTQNVSDVVGYNGRAFVLYSNGDLYGTGGNFMKQLGVDTPAETNTFIPLATGVSKIMARGNTSYYVTTTGALYTCGDQANGAQGISGNSTNVWTVRTPTNVTDVVFDGNSGAIALSTNGMYVAGYNTNYHFGIPSDTNLKLWDQASYTDITVIYSNSGESLTISDQRGTMTGTTFTPSTDGDYLYVPMENAVSYMYYVSDGSVMYAPDLTGQALSSHVVPDTTGIDADVTLTFSTISGYGGQISAVSTSTTDKDAIGLAVPYTVYYNVDVPTHYAYNWYGDSPGYAFTPSDSGDYVKVPGAILESFTYYVDDGATYYAENGTVQLASFTAPATSGVQGITLNFAADAELSGVYELTGSGSGYVVVPYTYDTTKTNEIHSITTTYTPVRGTVTNGAFTESATGDYMKVYEQNLLHATYYAGNDRAYYVAQNGSVSETGTVPVSTGLEHASLAFTALADPVEVYTVSGTLDAGYELLIPYAASYDVTETITTEKFPLAGLLPLFMIVSLICVFAFSLFRGREL